MSISVWPHILILSGPNLHSLGTREPHIYGDASLDTIHTQLKNLAHTHQYKLTCLQSNHEGALIDALWSTHTQPYVGVVFNPGAYAHTSLALYDAVLGIKRPVVEVHLSNIFSREKERQRLIIAPACIGLICGFGTQSYVLGLHALITHLTSVV